MKDYDILIQKGYKYVKFKNIDEFIDIIKSRRVNNE